MGPSRSFSTLRHAWLYSHHRTFSTSPSNTKLGFIGTGVMGQHMCTHLINAGYSMTIFNRTLSKCKPLENIGALTVKSPFEVAQNSDIIFSMVGYPSDVESTILDSETGVLSGCSSNKQQVIVDMTTSEPSLAIRIANQCFSSKKVSCLDAPVSGGDIGAKNASLAIMVGGDEDTYNRVLPLFEIMGKNIKHLGSSGSGQHTKMVNQILIASNMVGVCEGLLYGYRVGLDLEEVIKAIGSGAAGSFSLNVLAPRIVSGDLEPGFFVEHFIKDMGIALDEAKKMNISLPGLSLAHQLYIALKSQGHGKKGTQALILALESLSGYKDFAKMEQNKQQK